jgi:hypothetical protein
MAAQVYRAFRYALKHKRTNRLLQVVASGNGNAEFCNSYSAELQENNDKDGQIWLAHTREQVDAVLRGSHWSNSGLQFPQLDLNQEDLEVVEVTLKF